jgi:hypothetical protein
MKIFSAIILLVIIISLQITILSKLSFFGAASNIVLAAAIALALVEKGKKFDLFVFVLAACFDFLIGWPFGLVLLSVWLSFYAIKWLEQFLFRQSSFVSLFVLSSVGAILYQLFLIVFLQLASIFKYGSFIFSLGNFFTTIPFTIILNVFLCLLFFEFIKKVSFVTDVFNRWFIWSGR